MSTLQPQWPFPLPPTLSVLLCRAADPKTLSGLDRSPLRYCLLPSSTCAHLSADSADPVVDNPLHRLSSSLVPASCLGKMASSWHNPLADHFVVATSQVVDLYLSEILGFPSLRILYRRVGCYPGVATMPAAAAVLRGSRPTER